RPCRSCARKRVMETPTSMFVASVRRLLLRGKRTCPQVPVSAPPTAVVEGWCQVGVRGFSTDTNLPSVGGKREARDPARQRVDFSTPLEGAGQFLPRGGQISSRGRAKSRSAPFFACLAYFRMTEIERAV